MTKTYKETDDNVTCKICLRNFEYLGSHLWHGHKTTAKSYKSKYGLDYNLPLMSARTMQKKREAFEQDKEKYLKNIIGKGRPFKKGKVNRTRHSEQSKERYRKIGKEASLEGICPFCKMNYENVRSHLLTKHGYKLMKVKNGKY